MENIKLLIVLLCFIIQFIKCDLIIVKNTDVIEMNGTIIKAEFTNKYEKALQFRYCEIYGNQLEVISRELETDQVQLFTFVSPVFDHQRVDGHCYYRVPVFDGTFALLDILFYFNGRFNAEYYGMTSSAVYNVTILIPQSGYVRYFIF